MDEEDTVKGELKRAIERLQGLIGEREKLIITAKDIRLINFGEIRALGAKAVSSLLEQE